MPQTLILTQAVDRLMATVRGIVPADADPAALADFEVALGDMFAVALGAASSQSASAVVVLMERVHQELADLRTRLDAGGL